MKKFLTSLIIACLVISACKTSKKAVAPSSIDIIQLNNYFPKIELPLADTFNHFVISDSAVFNNQFGSAQTMTNTVDTINFATKIILAIQGITTTQKTIITFNKADLAGKELNVYYSAKTEEVLSYKMTPAAVATIPKGYSIDNVNFYRNNVKVFTIPL